MHSKGNFKIVPLGANGDELFVGFSSYITHYTTAGHAFLTLSPPALMQNKIDFPIDYIENVFVIPASV